ncbi:DUF305 domain-containing protein [Streptomyces sp. NPDC057743]|uniref:DUF305 domain-containing protein n=1 Tax=Streptomyces sp. NPDC057743 TaxID=3346236 RepID=UPI0036C47D53
MKGTGRHAHSRLSLGKATSVETGCAWVQSPARRRVASRPPRWHLPRVYLPSDGCSCGLRCDKHRWRRATLSVVDSRGSYRWDPVVPLVGVGSVHLSRTLRRRCVLTVVGAAAVLAVAACGGAGGSKGGTSSPTPVSGSPSAAASASAGAHNQADVRFAQEMTPHHRQAVVMADMAPRHGASSEVKALAEKIKQEQTPEIDTMSNWLTSWGERVPPEQSGMGPGSPSGMPGMMGERQMDELRNTRGTSFDKMFLTMMIEHHQGAVKMADTEKQQGSYGPAKDLAGKIATTQTAQIAQMRKMLAGSTP